MGDGEIDCDAAGIALANQHFTIIYRDDTLWVNAVRDWHVRHPNVGQNRKPPLSHQGYTTIEDCSLRDWSLLPPDLLPAKPVNVTISNAVLNPGGE